MSFTSPPNLFDIDIFWFASKLVESLSSTFVELAEELNEDQPYGMYICSQKGKSKIEGLAEDEDYYGTNKSNNSTSRNHSSHHVYRTCYKSSSKSQGHKP